ncbi:MAG: 30S ribosomal protein S20 [Candidatus Omnitrophota bacterium]|jgi:small subunit ribosomal protein S20|nr:MAG: 30S ribosomal protein S20 [Candidatus Omnitrophota bacterium]
MPRRRTSIKRKRADSKRRLRNLKIKNELKKVLKKFNSLAAAKNIEEAKKLLSMVFSKLDKAAKKNVIHKSMASRKKSRLMQRISKSA